MCVTISNRVARGGIGMALLMAVSVLAAACSGTTTQPATTVFKGASTASGSWPYPNGDLANTRDAAGSTISSANVSQLREAWSFKLAGKAAAGVGVTGSFAAAPVVVDGVVYIQDLDCNVYALSLAAGKLLWEHQVNTPEVSGPGPNGVALGGGRLYGTTPHTVFALSAATGKVIWSDGSLLNKGQGSFEIQPQVAGGRVYLASAYGSGPGGGVLFALDASTGKVIWRFNTLLGADTGVRSVGLGSGGAWETPLVGSDGSVTFGTGNPYRNAASAMAHPSAQLYTDSDVNLAAATGKLRWYYQGVPNDYMDHDMQASPISVMVGGVPVVIGSGKMGIVYAMNVLTGALLWKTPVGEHNGTDNDGLLLLEHKIKLTAPYTILPGPLGGVLSNMAVAGNSVVRGHHRPGVQGHQPERGRAGHGGGHSWPGRWKRSAWRPGRSSGTRRCRGCRWVPSRCPTTWSSRLCITVSCSPSTATPARSSNRHQLPTLTNAPIAIAGTR